MNIIDYQKWTLTTAVYPEAGQHTFNETVYLTLGLASEAGEFAGRIKKVIRGDQVTPESILSELGDCLWYLARLADNMGITLEDAASYNMHKLNARKQEGTIKGDDTSAGRIVTSDT